MPLLSAEPVKKCSVITAATAAQGRCEETTKEGAPARQEAVCRRKHSTATWGRLEAPLTAFFLSPPSPGGSREFWVVLRGWDGISFPPQHPPRPFCTLWAVLGLWEWEKGAEVAGECFQLDTETLCILALFPVINSGYYKNLLPSKDADKPPILLRRGFNIPPGELSALRGTGALSSISPPERAALLSDPIWHLLGLVFHFNPKLISFLAFLTFWLPLDIGAQRAMGLCALGKQTHSLNPINYRDFINREIICCTGKTNPQPKPH